MNAKEKENVFMDNIINEYNDRNAINNLRVNFTEYIDNFFDDFKTILNEDNLHVVPESSFVFNDKEYQLFLTENKKRIVSYLLLTKEEIQKYLDDGKTVFIYSYKFGGRDVNNPPKYMTWIEK